MIRLVFPEIDFAGRLNRAGFWRELAIAAFTTPILIGLVTYIVNEFTVAAAQGLAVDDASAKVLAGLVLTGIGVRNTIAFWSVVKRRMNDIGYGRVDLWRDSRPAVLAIVLSIVAVVASAFSKAAAVFFVPVIWIMFWQAGKFMRFTWRLLTAPSVHLRRRPTAEPADPFARHKEQLSRWLEHDSNGQAVGRLFTAINSEIEKFSKDGKASASWVDVKSAAAKVPTLAKLDSVRQWLDQPVVSSSASESATASVRSGPRQKAVYKSPPRQAVKLARSEPRRGRSSLLSGLLRGPWG